MGEGWQGASAVVGECLPALGSVRRDLGRRERLRHQADRKPPITGQRSLKTDCQGLASEDTRKRSVKECLYHLLSLVRTRRASI